MPSPTAMGLGIKAPAGVRRACRNGQTHEVKMSIQIGNYHADGPVGNVSGLLARSGVYVILGRTGAASRWSVIDIGEAGDIQDRVKCHDRAPQWRAQGHAELAAAAIYADERNRMLIERELRGLFRPPCGL